MMKMKDTLKIGLIVLAIVLMASGVGFAGNRYGGGAGDGTGPVHDIYAGVAFDIAGAVVTMVPGQGMDVATDTETLTIYGVGPYRYWVALGVDRPTVGDNVRVEGFIVDYNGDERYIPTAITVGDDVVPLRDTETGMPLWRGNKRGGGPAMAGPCFRNLK